MKNFVTGWRRAAPRVGAPVADPPRKPAPEYIEPERQRPPAKRPPEAEVIDAPRPRRPPQPISFPAFRPPGNIGQWLMIAIWAGLFKLSADATYAAIGGMLSSYTWALAVQGGLSVAERFHFAGNRNGFTWGALALDTLFTAVGLGIALLPAFFTTPAYGFLVDMAGGFGAGGFSGFSLGVLSLALGFVIAYSGDKALDLAVGR